VTDEGSQTARSPDLAGSRLRIDSLARTLWQGHASGAIADDDAQRLAEAIEARRVPARAAHKPVGIPVGRASIFPPRRVQRSPDRAKSIERRRTLAASGVMPPQLARNASRASTQPRLAAHASQRGGWSICGPTRQE
jgi:hypothetical protein